MTSRAQASWFWSKNVMFIAILLSGLLAGCSRSPIVEYYVLTPVAKTGERSIGHVGTNIIAMTTPGLPSYLDKDEIVERLPNNAVQIHEDQRWATDLDDMIRDFLIAALQDRVQSASFVSSDAKIARQAAARWEGVFTRLDIHQGREIDLVLSWHLVGAVRTTPQHLNQIRITESLQDDSVKNLVDTFNNVLARIADEISHSLGATEPSRDE